MRKHSEIKAEIEKLDVYRKTCPGHEAIILDARRKSLIQELEAAARNERISGSNPFQEFLDRHNLKNPFDSGTVYDMDELFRRKDK